MATEHPFFDRVLASLEPLMLELEPEATVPVILGSAMELFSAAAGSLGVVDGDEIEFTKMLGPAPIEGFRLSVDQGIAGWVARHGEGEIVNDVTRDRRFYDGVDRRTGFETRSLMCAPLRDGDRVIGVLQVLNTSQRDGFSVEDLQGLTAFGRLVSTVLGLAKEDSMRRDTQQALLRSLRDRHRLISGGSAAMAEAIRIARTVAGSAATLLLLGESGTGKEVFARAVHEWSPRSERAFLAVNCAALPLELLESELFGHEKGAFTGAVRQKKGMFEVAHRGTLLLDEIGDLPAPVQVKLLRVLQEREFQRIGGEKVIRSDVRIIAATNRDLRAAMAHGDFREDLFYRLNVVSVTLPPLRERPDDIETLARHFLERHRAELGRPGLELAPTTLQALRCYAWPGNVRELENAMERAALLAPEPQIGVADLPPEVSERAAEAGEGRASGDAHVGDLPLKDAIDRFKMERIRRALEKTGGNQTRAAELLGIQQPNLSRMMKTLGLSGPPRGPSER